MKNKTKIVISFKENGCCDVGITEGKMTTYTGARNPMQLIGLLFQLITNDKKLKKKIDNWIVRMHGDHAEVIDELMYDKFEEVANFATTVRKSLYK